MSRSVPKLEIFLLAALCAGVPLLAHAQPPSNLADIVTRFLQLIDVALPIVMLLALVVFMWGAVKLIATAGDDTSRVVGRRALLWGLITLFIMVSVWGIVRIIRATLLG